MTKASSLNASSVWNTLRDEAELCVKKEPLMAGLMRSHILDHKSFDEALAFVLATKLAYSYADTGLGVDALFSLFQKYCSIEPDIISAAKKDLLAVSSRDPSVTDVRTPFLYFKGYQALQAHRIAHSLWLKNKRDTARFLQSQMANHFGVDIHPAARIGHGVMIDHANGVVIGETAVIENDVSLLHGVTLGGTGNEEGDRHPKVRKGVLIGAGATILGNIEIGEGSRIAAGSMVLTAVPPHVTVAGVPARIVGKAGCAKPGTVMDQIPKSLITPDDKSAKNCDFEI